MKHITRRDFVKSSVAAGVTLALTSRSAKAQPKPAPKPVPYSPIRTANEDLRVAIVGLGHRGSSYIKWFHELPKVTVAALCDPDRKRLNDEVKKFKDRKEKVNAYTDIRRLLNNRYIDVVVVATCDHWHGLATVLACQAGKDVYVETPVSLNISEGRKMVQAARKYGRIVQVATPTRSDNGLAEAIEYVQKGELGKIQSLHCISYVGQNRKMGKVAGPQVIPDSIDYNLWTGPALLMPVRRRHFHYHWRWLWDYGCGEIGSMENDQLDICRRFLGQAGTQLPPRVISIGGRFGVDDNGETANTQIAILDYEPAPIICEIRTLPRNMADVTMDAYRGVRESFVVQCEGGYLADHRAYNKKGKKIRQFERNSGNEHIANFIEAVKSRKVTDLNADIFEGHISTALCHMANISHRLGYESTPEKVREVLKSNNETSDAFQRLEAHLTANQIDLKATPLLLGPILKMDSNQERFVGDFPAQWANQMLTREYRKPFLMPI